MDGKAGSVNDFCTNCNFKDHSRNGLEQIMKNILSLAYLIPLLPLLGFLINGLGRKFLSKSLIGIIGSGVILASFIFSLLVFMEARNLQEPFVANYFNFISVDKLVIPFAFQVDQLSSIFL